MPTIPEQLAALTLRDDFNRADEDPMATASWTKLPWCEKTGKVKSNLWTPTTGFATKEDGAYWNPAEYKNPAVIAGPLAGAFLAERWIAIWAALNPATHSGYRFRLISLEKVEAGKHEWRIEKVVEGVASTLASGTITGAKEDKFALTVVGGSVTAWRNEGAEWKEIKAVADATYTEGRVALEGRGFEEHEWDNFYGGELEGAEEPTIKPNPATATASRPEPAVANNPEWGVGSATASMPSSEAANGAMPSATEREHKGLPLPFPSVLANPARLGPPRFNALDRKTLGL